MIYCSTETLADDPELIERSVEVRLPRTLRAQFPEYGTNFEAILYDNARLDNLSLLAKQLVSVALTKTEQEAFSLYTSNLPNTPIRLDSRPKIGYAVCLAGLDHLINTLTERGYSLTIVSEVQSIKDKTVAYLLENSHIIVRDKKLSEIDSVINTLVQALSSSNDKQKWFVVTGDKLLVDIVQMYNYYRGFCMANQYRIEYGRPSTLISDIEEDYELVDQECPTIKGDFTNQGRITVWHRLSLKTLEDRRINIGVFR
jgi:hypothetical protein